MSNLHEENTDYALKALQNGNIRSTEEFNEWISVPENRELFTNLMAYREALMRNEVSRKATFRRRILFSTISAAAAAILALILINIGGQNGKETTGKFFAAISEDNNITIQTDNSEKHIVADSVKVINYAIHNIEETDIKPCRYTLRTPRGKNISIVLADGSKVMLNSESSLSYPTDFGDERRVELTGEAYFEVAKDSLRPFVVCSEGLETHVLGTKYNIRSYSKDDRHVTLIQGKVKVCNCETGSSSILSPGQDITYDNKQNAMIESVNTSVFTAWTEGLFYFEDSSLKDIMTTLGRWYNMDIRFEDTKLEYIKLNFWTSRNGSIEESIMLLNKLGKIKAEYKDNAVTIKNI